MLLLLTLIDRNRQGRTFGCYAFKYEEAFDTANRLLNLGDQVIEIRLIDENTTTILPFHVIDGHSFSAPIRQLAQEWQQLLMSEK